MAEDLRAVTVTRLQTGVYEATNARGGTLRFGSSAGEDFTPVELLLAAVAGCSAVDVDTVTSRRAEPEQFRIEATGQVEHGKAGNILQDLAVTFHLRFPTDSDGEAIRTMAERALTTSHQRSCTVSRTIEARVPITMTIAQD